MPLADYRGNQTASVVVTANLTFFILDAFSAGSVKLQHEEEFPEWSAQRPMKTHRNPWLVGYTRHTARSRRSLRREGNPSPGKVC